MIKTFFKKSQIIGSLRYNFYYHLFEIDSKGVIHSYIKSEEISRDGIIFFSKKNFQIGNDFYLY